MEGCFECDNLEKTAAVAAQLAAQMRGGEVIAFFGDLGSGKTAFTTAFAAALGCPETVTSPTFVIMNRYRGRLTVNHFDMYRIHDLDSLFSIGYFDVAGQNDSVTLIEWCENVIDFISPPDIVINASAEGDKHIFDIRGRG